MKISIAKRLLSFLLAAVIVLGLVPAVVTPEAEAALDYASLRSAAGQHPYPVGVRLSSLPSSMDGIWLITSTTPRADNSNFYAPNPSVPETNNSNYTGYAVKPAYIGADWLFDGPGRDFA